MVQIRAVTFDKFQVVDVFVSRNFVKILVINLHHFQSVRMAGLCTQFILS